MTQGAHTQSLVERLRAQDPTAVADLSESYGAKIYQLAFRYLRNREDAEEVAQDVLLKVYQKIEAFRGDAALSSWIYRITFNAAMSRLRQFKQNLPNPIDKASDEETGQPLKREVVDFAPLADYAQLCRETGTILIVDEAHAVGVYGSRGSGWIEQAGCIEKVFLSIDTAGKALGASGAFVSGSSWAVDYLIQRARPFMFSTA